MDDASADPVRFEAAAGRFRSFFQELGETFVEREDVLQQIALALLCREHVLLTGPPGTAKSQLASAVLGRIVDEVTGKPSLFSRQFTESTVQTDLVGPIDFKTLVESGRTTHFTDEGMLGAVHAFLDEVFDGRDMLLRAALNVLQERELKEGTRVTRGRIECSLMTSNRYLSDVLEHSRPTLLAFVDRIAFNAFVPRAFADRGHLAAVLRRHVGGAGMPLLRASLSIQDLDVLQAAVDALEVDDEACDAIGALLEALDVEMSAAVRADASFAPTRYLSTRTAVRSGRILRAIVVHERVMQQGAPVPAGPHHLGLLRLHLLLSGPSPEATRALLERETDPNERRQLSIVRTEREVFDRVWRKLGFAKRAPKAVAATPGAAAPDPAALLDAAIAEGPRAVTALLGRLSTRGQGTSKDAAAARAAAAGAVAALNDAAARAALGARGKAATREAPVEVTGLADLADAIDDGTDATRPIARWLRGQALGLLEQAADRLSWGLPDGDAATADARIEARFAGLSALSALRARLTAKGADAAASSWLRTMDRVEEELALLYDDALRAAMAPLFSASGAEVTARIASLGPQAERLDQAELRLSALREAAPRRDAAGTVKARVLGPRIASLLQAALARLEAKDRGKLAGEVRAIVSLLSTMGLRHAVAAPELVAWAAEAALRAAPGRAADEVARPLDLEGYRALRLAEDRVPCVVALAEIALDVVPPSEAPAAPGLGHVRELLGALPEPLRARAVREDEERIARAIEHLERWWARVAAAADEGDALRVIAESKFFHVVLDESALVRFSLEASLVGELFPERAEAATALGERARALEEGARSSVFEHARRQGERAWTAAADRGA